ncbi:MAG: aminoacetone oxidase family FAD-binding enzyme [Elusimicrobiaceae bacterium]|nr:aminoacetone oxidase family FAD-binding enzyme [Elusimicrobiaceae bacterium]
MLTYHTVIIGGGASGLFCAGSFDKPKLILEHNKRPGAKVRVSGGGKCNFTHTPLSAADYVCSQKHFCKNALAAFKPQDFTTLLQAADVDYETRPDGCLFAQRAGDIADFLERRARQAHSDFSLDTQALGLEKTDDGFFVCTSAGTIQAQQVVLACGGLSYPKLGSSSFGIKVARQFDLNIVEQRPALCGLTVQKPLRAVCKALAGNSTPVQIRTGEQSATGPLLFTHEGFSGPAVLDISLYWKEGSPVTINFLPEIDVRALLAAHKQENKRISSVIDLPGHIAAQLLGNNDAVLANATKLQLETAARLLNGFTFIPVGTSGYIKAEVTAGGVDVREINPSTFEVKKVPGLYVIGELLDVTGKVGGYNLHWAWASGYCAAQHLAKK